MLIGNLNVDFEHGCNAVISVCEHECNLDCYSASVCMLGGDLVKIVICFMYESLHFSMVALTLALICLLSCVASFNVSGLTYYVKPDADTQCPHQPCETLTYYANNVADFFTTNTTFIFLKGTHLFGINRLLLIENISGLILRGNGSLITSPQGLLEPSSEIECQGVTGFSFTNIANFSIELLTFVGCGAPSSHRYYAALFLFSVTDFTITEVAIRNSTGYGLNATLIFGNSSISESTFAYNSGTDDYYGGNVHFLYKNCPGSEINYLLISSSKFLYGINPHGGAFASGLSLLVQCTNVKIAVIDSFFRGNTADNRGGNLALAFLNETHQFPSNTLTLSNSYIEDGVSYRGGGMYIKILQAVSKENNTCNFKNIFHFSDTHFIGNSAVKFGGGLYFYSLATSSLCSGGNVAFENCKFHSNSVHAGGAAVYITTLKVIEYISGRVHTTWHSTDAHCIQTV